MGLVLASASPRRSELLRAAGIDVEVQVADVDERRMDGEQAEAYVERVARSKAEAIVRRGERRHVLAADTVVVIDGRILGKPSGRDDARDMLRALSGRVHEVLTGVCILPGSASGVARKAAATDAAATVDEGTARPVEVTDIARTLVEFVPLSAAEIEWYLDSGEPMDKAGAYAIQGLASRFVSRIEGSYSNVVGLPISLVYAMCRRLGILVS